MSNAPETRRGFWFWLRFIEIRLRFVVLLVLTGLVVGYWEDIQNHYERWQRVRHGGAAIPAEQAAPDTEYYCPMHTFVVRASKGKCPICGMDLSERKKGAPVELPEGVAARVQVSPERIMQSGVQVEAVAYRDLVQAVRAYGVIEPDETLQTRLIARFPGRIDSLKVKSVGQAVKKGEALAEIYSPEYYAAANEYLIAWKSLNRAADRDSTEGRRARSLVESARQRLSLAGFTGEQFSEIEAKGEVPDHVALFASAGGTVTERSVLEGEMVQAGSPLLTIADFSRVWIQAQVLESETGAVRQGMPAEVTLVAWPGEIFRGTVDFIYPTVSPETRTVKVRVVIDNERGKLKPGMYANIVFRSPLGNVEKVTAEEVAAHRAGKPGDPAAAAAGGYWCPMHHDVRSDKPGECPECGMKLKPVPAGEAGASSDGSDRSGRSDKSETTPARYWCPMHHEVRSAEPGSCPKCGMDLVPMPATSKAVAAEEAPKPVGPRETEWAYGWSCEMHPDELESGPGVCTTCGCGMPLEPVRVQGVLSVPELAVIDTGTRRVVFTEAGAGVFDAREVVLGPRVGTYYPVLKGLEPGDRVVSRGSFLIDAEARLNPVGH